jgi:hypothetical protein
MSSIVYKKLTDIENQKENPFNTAFGQSVVTVEENFWSRLLRYGRSAYKTWFEISIGAADSINALAEFVPTPNTVFIPKVLTFSASVDCLMYVLYKPASNYNVFESILSTTSEVYAVVRVTKNTPYTLYFDGDIQIAEGGNITVVVKPLSEANGKVDGCIRGTEVTSRA